MQLIAREINFAESTFIQNLMVKVRSYDSHIHAMKCNLRDIHRNFMGFDE
jgi:predicted PhzF superfamily epimerase YddE/YHI9